MGSHPSDKVPQLTKHYFAIINSAPSNDRGEHWTLTARVDKIYYFADSMGRKITTYSFLTKKKLANGSQNAPKKYNFCGFYAIYSTCEKIRHFHTKSEKFRFSNHSLIITQTMKPYHWYSLS